MKTIWFLRGKPGFAKVTDEEAQRLVDLGHAQIADGKTKLERFDPTPIKKRRGRPPKYPNKMMASE